jgi:hypothetical protein
VTTDCQPRLLLIDLASKHNLAGITSNSGRVASWIRGNQVSLYRSLKMHAGETACSLRADNLQSCMTGYSAAYAIVGEQQRAGRPTVE